MGRRRAEGDLNNQAPEITSNLPTSGAALAAFIHEPVATDADDDELTWRLLEAPAGARINAETGAHAATDPCCSRTVRSCSRSRSPTATTTTANAGRFVDPKQSGNNPPSIEPVDPGVLRQRLYYQLVGVGLDGDLPSWRLVNAPEGDA